MGAVSEIPASDWDRCSNPDGGIPVDPFTTHRFLVALEESGSVGPETGWQPRPIVVREGGAVVAVAPLYVKSHSQGEYIFDHSWAEGYARAGGRYYPKLQVAVPFTPATGRRFLTLPGWEQRGRAAILQTLEQVAGQNGLSSVHVTFCTADEAQGTGWLPRVTQQFHWHNDGYRTYDDFMSALSSRKRKALRKERERAQGFGGTIRALTGDALRPEHWDAFWTFYQDTGA
ncbi:MAG: peptidogalycan biosysnthesis protein, partial [Gemmobacter sp.]|nr:peptidogalycan biosysnthesis protein [Gemmobacter sp.]